MVMWILSHWSQLTHPTTRILQKQVNQPCIQHHQWIHLLPPLHTLPPSWDNRSYFTPAHFTQLGYHHARGNRSAAVIIIMHQFTQFQNTLLQPSCLLPVPVEQKLGQHQQHHQLQTGLDLSTLPLTTETSTMVMDMNTPLHLHPLQTARLQQNPI